ncbi:MAG: alpha/beta fold hydrolase [Woeseiaceae bacterium]|nr:alpha/beta fold hydrolase [Woeseiaceae bacterium]
MSRTAAETAAAAIGRTMDPGVAARYSRYVEFMKQPIHYVRTADGISLAWARSGRGPQLARASNWLTHLEYDWESPVWTHWTRFLAQHFSYVRYDERGCGMTDWKVGELSLDQWVTDLETVVDAAGMDDRITLFGVSQGAAVAIAYAVRHPERVATLILYGGYAIGARWREDADHVAAYRAMQELARIGWQKPNPAFRQVFTSRFIPEGTEEQVRWFNDLCQRTTTPEIAYQLLAARAEVDIRPLLQHVAAPTLVLHGTGDEVVPASEGRRLAAGIPGASFVPLDSRNHVLLADEPAWQDFKDAVLEFTGLAGTGGEADIDALTARERDVFRLLCAGSANARIAGDLGIAEKTVRNHVSRIYEKLGVRSRAEALVMARRKNYV